MPGPLFTARYTKAMQLIPQTYLPRNSAVHALDARVKIVLLLAFSVALFLVDSWVGLLIAACVYAGAHLASRLPFSAVAKMGIPLYALVAVAVVFGSISLNYAALQAPSESMARAAGVFARFEPFCLAGPIGVNPAGFGQALFNGARVVILLYASLIVSLSTTSEDVRSAFVSFLRPLRRLNVPVDDAASALSIALRFIPQTAQELVCVRNAQWSRGAAFSGEGVIVSLRAWATVFVALFVRLFRRADLLAQAMDARCYGATLSSGKRTSLNGKKVATRDYALLGAGLAASIALAAFF